jgi:hypothetical protein
MGVSKIYVGGKIFKKKCNFFLTKYVYVDDKDLNA